MMSDKNGTVGDFMLNSESCSTGYNHMERQIAGIISFISLISHSVICDKGVSRRACVSARALNPSNVIGHSR